MKFYILIPHFRTKELTEFSVSQFLKFKGKHDVEIMVIDNSYPEDTTSGLSDLENVTVIHNKSDKVTSHGTALDIATNLVSNEWVIAAESDSFPTVGNWLDYYENLISNGYDCAGSRLLLSGGTYTHPAGMLYRKSVWLEAMEYVKTIPYNYYPNFMMRDNFPVHTMIHKSLVDEISRNPNDWVELSSEYKDRTEETMRQKLDYYYPVGTGVFHNGMGGRQESVKTYGLRTPETEKDFVFLTNKNQKIIGRLGLEPGQWLSYYMAATGRKIFDVPTEVKWVNGKVGQQQEYTLMKNGFTHIWCGTSYLSMKGTEANDIYEFKKNQIESIIKTI